MTRRMQFSKSYRKKLVNRPTLHSVSEKYLKATILAKDSFKWFISTQIIQLWKTWRKLFIRKTDKFLLGIWQKHWGNIIFFDEIVCRSKYLKNLRQKVVLGRKTQFQLPWRQNFAKGQENFRSKSETGKMTSKDSLTGQCFPQCPRSTWRPQIFQTNSSNWLSRHEEYSCDRLSEKFHQKLRQFFSRNLANFLKKLKIFRRNWL